MRDHQLLPRCRPAPGQQRGDLTRRRFLGHGARLATAAAVGWSAGDALIGDAAAAEPELLASFLADVTGNGSVGAADIELARQSVDGRRGLEVVARSGYDYRADVFGRGRVDGRDTTAISHTRSYLRNNDSHRRPRPVVVNWHYGWFNHAARQPKQHHVWFKGGGYSSRDAEAEALFNDLKNEFGITVDALSWADPTADGNLNNNLQLGYMNAANGRTRHAALLYESLISLRIPLGGRADFQKARTRNRLIDHFRGMARTFRALRDSKARIFTIDGRPVVFIYASHTWGTNVDGSGPQYDRIDEAMENSIKSFQKLYGERPFVIGEETTFAESDRFDEGRRRRSANFDGVFNYHHASSGDFIRRGGQNLRGRYVDQVKEVLINTYAGAIEHASRFTGRPLLVVPSFAAGFSKRDVPTLHANRRDYGEFLFEMLAFHSTEYMLPAFGEGRLNRVVPVVSVGSWNEEWEGHAVMPSQFNRTLSPRTQQGFDYVMAIKQAFGWNHYADRSAQLSY